MICRDFDLCSFIVSFRCLTFCLFSKYLLFKLIISLSICANKWYLVTAIFLSNSLLSYLAILANNPPDSGILETHCHHWKLSTIVTLVGFPDISKSPFLQRGAGKCNRLLDLGLPRHFAEIWNVKIIIFYLWKTVEHVLYELDKDTKYPEPKRIKIIVLNKKISPCVLCFIVNRGFSFQNDCERRDPTGGVKKGGIMYRKETWFFFQKSLSDRGILL